MKKKILTSFYLLVLTFFNISAHNSIWPNNNYIKNEDKSVCIQFQYLKGSNRLAEFGKIEENIFHLNNTITNTVYSITNFPLEEIEKVLGEPDTKTTTRLQYKINPSDNSVVKFEKIGKNLVMMTISK